MQPIHPIHARRVRGARSSRSRRAALALAASALLSIAACGGGATEPGAQEGTGTVTASGTVSTSGNGLALFQSISSGSTSLFQIMIMPTMTAPSWTVQIANYTGRLAVGTYELAPLSVSSGKPTANFYYLSGGAMETFGSTSGELVITSSSPSAVRGTYSFTATNIMGVGTVTAQGSFNAECAAGTACQ